MFSVYLLFTCKIKYENNNYKMKYCRVLNMNMCRIKLLKMGISECNISEYMGNTCGKTGQDGKKSETPCWFVLVKKPCVTPRGKISLLRGGPVKTCVGLLQTNTADCSICLCASLLSVIQSL